MFSMCSEVESSTLFKRFDTMLNHKMDVLEALPASVGVSQLGDRASLGGRAINGHEKIRSRFLS